MASDRNLKVWIELRLQMYLEGCGGEKEDVKKVYDQPRWLHDFAKGNPTADIVWRTIQCFASFHNRVSAPARTLNLYATTVQTMSL